MRLKDKTMDAYIVRLVDCLNDFFIVFRVGYEIQIVGIQNQDSHIGLLFDEVEIALLQVLKI